MVPDFDYSARPEGKLEVPLAERIAAIRARKAEDRARSEAKAARAAQSRPASQRPASQRPASPGSGQGRGRRRPR